MKLEKLALIAEIIGGVAVVVSLLYVGIGIRQNTDAIMVANHQNILAMDIEKNSWLRDPNFAELYDSALSDEEELSGPRKWQFRAFVADLVNIWENIYITHQKGLIDTAIWEGYDSFYGSQIRLPAYRRIWEEGRDGWSGDFAKHVDAALASD